MVRELMINVFCGQKFCKPYAYNLKFKKAESLESNSMGQRPMLIGGTMNYFYRTILLYFQRLCNKYNYARV
jgi:hypothetical protein